MSINKSMKEPVMVRAPKTDSRSLEGQLKKFFWSISTSPPWFSSRSRNDAASAAFPGWDEDRSGCDESFRGHGSINAKCLAQAFISLRAVRTPRGAAPHRVGFATPVLVAPAHRGHVMLTRRKSTGMKIKIWLNLVSFTGCVWGKKKSGCLQWNSGF